MRNALLVLFICFEFLTSVSLSAESNPKDQSSKESENNESPLLEMIVNSFEHANDMGDSSRALYEPLVDQDKNKDNQQK